MDTSKEYIKMCDCEEIQGFWEPQSGDYIKLPKDGWIVCTGCVPAKEWKDDLWLPRQDQLQEMIKDKFRDNDELLCEFYDCCFGGIVGDEFKKRNEMSLEQLWLAFIMKEKFNKTWDKDKWK
jgi:hypothetical protein